MPRIITIFTALLFCSGASAQMRQFYTARLDSTSGAGVASLSLVDALFLNPASSAFFQKKVISYQNKKVAIDNINSARFSDKSKSHVVAVMDTSGSSVQGGLVYEMRDEFGIDRTRYRSNFSKRLGKKSALGINYSYIKDKYEVNGENKKWHQLTLGVTHVLSPKITLGLVIVDPFHRTQSEAKMIAGAQYRISKIFSLIADISGQFLDEASETLSWRGALQVKAYKDLYIRSGIFNDKQEGSEGQSFGISWYSPKLMIDIAYKTSKPQENGFVLYKDEKMTEISSAVSIRF